MSATRITNNQITVGTIDYTRIASGTLVGSLFNPTLTLNSNVTISGNLSVIGNTTTINATNTYINDPLVVFNNGYSGSLSGYDIGIIVNRNLASLGTYGSVNTAWVWVESDSAFEALATTSTGGNIQNINNSGFANVKLGNLTSIGATTGTMFATLVNAATIGNTGAVLTGATGTFATSVTTPTVTATTVNAATIGNSGAVLTGTLSTAAQPNVTSLGTLTGLTVAGTETVTTINANAVNAATIGNASAALSGATGTFTGTVIAQTVNAATIGNTGAAITGATGAFATSVTTATVTATTVNAATIGNTGAAIAGATGTFTGTVIAQTVNAATIGNTGAAITGATLNTSGTATVNALTSNGAVLGTTATFNAVNAATIGNASAALSGATGTFTGIVIANAVNAATIGNAGAVLTGATLNTSDTATVNSLTSNGAVLGTTATFNAVNAATIGNASAALNGATITTTANVITNLVQAQTINAATIGNASAALTGATGTFSSWANITGTTQSTGTTTGALIVNGGVGIAKDVYVGGNITTTSAAGNISGVNTVFASTVQATTVNAATIGNTGAALSGATGTFTGTVIAQTVNAATIGNSGAVLTGTLSTAAQPNVTSVGTLTGLTIAGTETVTTINANAVNAATIGNVGATLIGTLSASNVLGTTATANVAIYGNVLALSSANNATFYPLLGNVTAGNTTFDTSSTLGYNPSSGNLSAGYFVGSAQYLTNINPGAIGTVAVANVAYYDVIQPVTNNATYYLTYANLVSGNSTINATTYVNVNPSTSTVYANAFSGGSGAFTTLAATGVTTLTNGTQASSVTTGALQVTGGISTQANLYVGGNLKVVGNLEVDGTLTYLNTTTTLISGTEIVAGAVTANSTTAATNTTSGALQVAGGVGVIGAIYSGGGVQNTVIGNATPNSGYFTNLYVGTEYANAINAATIGNVGASGQFGNVIAQTVNAATIGNTGAVLTGATGTFTTSVTTPTVTATTVNAATIGNTGAALSGATINLSSTASIGGTATVNALTSNGAVLGTTATFNAVNAATIGNASAALSGATGTFTGIVIANAVNAATIGNTGALLTGATLNTSGTATVNSLTSNGSVLGTTAIFNTVNAATIGNTGATLTGSYAVTTANLTTATVLATTVNAATIGNTSAVVTGATGTFTTSVTTPTVTATTVNAATIGNASAALSGATGTFTGTVIAQTVNAATIGNTGATLIGTLSASNIAGTVATANVAIYANVLALSNNATFYPLLGNVTAGNTTTGTSTSLSYNPSTGNLSATAFIGNGQYLTNINTSGLTIVPLANVAYFVNETATTTNATFYPILGNTNAANGNSAAFTNSSLSYNPSSGQLSASSFSGAISSSMVTTALGYTPYNSTNPAGYQTSSGSVNSATYATQASTVAINAATTSSVYYPIFVPSNTTTAQYEYVDGNNYLQYNPGTGNLATKVLTATSNVFIGTPLNYTPANAPVQVGYNINNYSQFSIQNANNGNNASTDIAVVANNGSDNDTYVDMGIVSSTYNQAAYSLYKPNDGYLIVSGNTTTGGGNLILNTYQANDIVFATGGTTAKFEVARITSGNTVVVKSTNNNTLSANTGAFQLWGGASISGNAYIGGSSYQMGGALFNHNQASAGTSGSANQNAFIMQGVNDSTLIYAKPLTAYDAVIIGGNAASTSFAQGAKLVVNSTDSMLLPVGTSAQRPSSTGGTDTTGMMRYSTTQGAIEWYNGTSWATASTSFTVITDQQFTGTGSQTQFTLTSAATTAATIVSINGVIQIPTLAYSVFTGNSQLIFTEAPLTTDVIDVRTLTTTQTVNQLYDTSGYNTVNTITGTGITFTTGTSSATTQYTINTSGAIASSVANVTIASAATPTTVDSFFGNTYSTAKYILSSTYNGVKEAAEALVVSNGATSNIVVYGTINTAGNTLTTWSTTMSGNVVNLVGTTTNAGTVIRMTKQYNAV